MNHYLNLFSPSTAQAFADHGKTVSGFTKNQSATAQRLRPGDKFVCYVTKISRWIGVLGNR